MIWNVLFRPLTVSLPRTLNADTMYPFVQRVIDDHSESTGSRVVFDFQYLEFIEPVGVVVLSNLIEYLRVDGARVRFTGHTSPTMALKFLDDSQFFRHYIHKQIFTTSAVRPTTVPLSLIRKDRSQEYLLKTLMPWIGGAVDMSADSLDAVRSSLEEVLHNVSDHSGVEYGCTFAQHFPNKNKIQIAISDFGRGIPSLVRTVVPGISDTYALRKACEEGFTTKSNVQNRGAGLPTLMRYVTQRNGGNVLIAAANAALTASATPNNGTKISTRATRGYYPGTLVRVILRTDTLEDIARDAEPESFEW